MKDATAEGGTAPPSDIAARLGAFSARVRLAIGVLTGVVLALGHAPVGFPWSAFLALPVFVWLISRAPGPRGAAIAGWAVGFGYFVLSLHWIGHAFLVDADAFAWLLPVALTGLPAGLALFWALAAYAARRIAGAGAPGATRDLRIAIILAGA
ncbi:MAG: apolipoprotein N-acyltransferase, partial [Pseudomonadota bacterium]